MSTILSIPFLILGLIFLALAVSFPVYLIYGIVYMLVLHRQGKGSYNVAFLILSFLCFVIFIVVYASASASRPRAMLAVCRSHCRCIGTALEMYASDNKEQFPDRLERLTPTYMKYLPSCGEDLKCHYAESYQTDSNRRTYTFCCKGANHIIQIKAFNIPLTGNQGAMPDYPQYSKQSGLIVRPGSGKEEK